MAKKLRDKILSINDIKAERMVIPEWDNAEIEVRSVSGAQRAMILQNSLDPKTGAVNFGSMYQDLLICGVYDPEDGQAVFEPTDRETVSSKNGGVIERIAKVIARMSGLDDESLETAAKN